MTADSLQGEFGFDRKSRTDGYTHWIALRQLTTEAAAAKLNLPLGHRCEIWLANGVRLRGILRLVTEVLSIEETRLHELPLVLDKVTFRFNEMESCLRLD